MFQLTQEMLQVHEAGEGVVSVLQQLQKSGFFKLAALFCSPPHSSLYMHACFQSAVIQGHCSFSN